MRGTGEIYRFELVERTERRLCAGDLVVVLDVGNLRFDRILRKQVADRLVVYLQNAHSDVEDAVRHLNMKTSENDHLCHLR